MRLSVLQRNGRILSRGAAVLLVAGMAAGCSTQAARFGGGGIDDLFTASTPNQRQIISQNDQPFPAQAPVAAAPVDGGNTGSVSRGALAPVSTASSASSSAPLAPVSSTPVRSASLGDTTTGTLEQPAMATANNPRTAAPKSSRGDSLPADQLPKPADNVAVLPQPPKLKEGETAPQASASNASGAYTVQDGDTLTRISKRTGHSVAALKQANGMEDGLIRVGQTLKIPSGGNSSVASAGRPDPVVTGAAGPAKPARAEQVASSAPPKAEQVAGYTPPKKAVAEVEDDSGPAPNATGIGRMRWPARGRVISTFGNGSGKSSDGIDIAVPEGTPVKAAENGVVIYAGDGLKEFGNTVLVRHENGLVTVYGHASELKVSRGEQVKRGQEIAVSGMSGTTDAPKLHFEVRKNSAPVDPSGYLE